MRSQLPIANPIKVINFVKKYFMSNPIKYMVNDRGTRTSAIVPIKTWMKINDEYRKLQKKLTLLVGLKGALQETREARKTGKKLQTLKDFLNESNS